MVNKFGHQNGEGRSINRSSQLYVLDMRLDYKLVRGLLLCRLKCSTLKILRNGPISNQSNHLYHVPLWAQFRGTSCIAKEPQNSVLYQFWYTRSLFAYSTPQPDQ